MINIEKLENNVKNTKKKINTLDTIFGAVVLTTIFFIIVICQLMIH